MKLTLGKLTFTSRNGVCIRQLAESIELLDGVNVNSLAHTIKN